ncbi:MAG: LiaF domain-containing protein [Micromonosporaceae bacterium]
MGGVVVSAAVIVVGVVGLVDLAGVSVHASTYLAAPLAVIALGLIVGAWYGRARWLIAIGAVLTLALGIASVSEAFSHSTTPTTWMPATLADLEGTYTLGLGDAVLDLSTLDFTGQSKSVDINVDIGDLTIIVPSDVDVRAEATVDVGNATVFGSRWGGIGQSTRTVTDNGADGPGGGELIIRATVDVGNVEVRR